MPKAPRIFVVEDDESIRMLLEVALRSSGYTVSAFPNAADALAEMENTVPDAAVLDIMLDGMDGITALKLMRANARLAGVPVMMLTAKDSENDKIIGLDAGADDYMTKPFSVLELCARVRALLRRGGAAPAPKKGGVLKSGGLKLDLAVREATRDGALLELTYKEFELLRELMENAPGAMNCCKVFGATTSSAKRARWTCTSARCAISWATRAPRPGTLKPYAAWDTAFWAKWKKKGKGT